MTQIIKWQLPKSFSRQRETLEQHLIELLFTLAAEDKTDDRVTNKQQLKAAAVKNLQNIPREETQHWFMFMGSRLQAVFVCKRIFI